MKDFYKHILISIITYILFSSFLSCTENVISYNEITENNQEKLINKDTLDKTGLNRIDFWAGINNNYFRSYGSEPIQTDINVSIYAFYYGGDSVTSAQYVSKTAGALTPVDNPMELLGLYKYSIYAAAVNNKNVVSPKFENTSGNFNDTLTYNYDYIWTANYEISPDTNPYNCDLQFKHRCTQVVINLEIGDSVDVEDLIYMCLTPSVKEDLKWNLYSGFIGPSTSISPISFTFPHTLTDNVYSGQLIMPPLKMDNSDDLTVTFEVKINIDSVVYQHTYHAELPVYDQYLMADTSYHYDLLLRIDTVIFNSVNIKDWVTDSITSPIIPDLEN